MILDLARGFAALWVLVFHLWERGQLNNTWTFVQYWAEYGSLGVPLFFVISGFCITASAVATIRHGQSTGSFFKRRLLRILPPFWASLAVIFSLPYISSAMQFFITGKSGDSSSLLNNLTAVDWLQFITLMRVFFNEGNDLQIVFLPVCTVYWTLAIELQFYCIIGCALIFRKYFGRILLLLSIASIATYFLPVHVNKGVFLWYWPMFAAGILLYYTRHYKIALSTLTAKHAVRISVIASTIIAGSILFLFFTNQFGPVFRALFKRITWGFAGISAVFLWCCDPLENVLKKVKESRTIAVWPTIHAGLFLGNISYSIYLLHLPLIGYVERCILLIRPELMHWAAIISFLVILPFAAIFSYCIERPFKSSNKRLSIN